MLTLNNVSFSYGAIQAVRDINIHIAAGEMVCLIGSNGAGKSTILSLISGLLRPAAGVITFCDEDVTVLPAAKRVARGLIHVPEGRQIFAKLTIEENLRLGGYLISDREAYRVRLDYVCSLFPVLAERRKQNAGTLSGGEQQMLAIARALIGKPKLMLLDEPSLGLSPMMMEQVFAVVENLKHQGITMLMVEQNAYDALQISDRCYVLETGKIAMEGDSRALIGNEDIKKAYLGGA